MPTFSLGNHAGVRQGPIRSLAKRVLSYSPSPQTAAVRAAIASKFDSALPFCPPPEGELLRELILQHNCRRCLQVGFATGSTALYMLQALADTDGEVVSIDRPDGPYNAVGTSLLEAAAERMTLASHRLIEDDSVNAIPRLFQAGEVFDLIFVDGWKTFDHLAAEIYYLSRMLKVGGVMVFDDAAMPSVNKAIQMLLAYYRYLEIDYKRYGQTRRLRTFHILTTKSIRRPYRGFLKGQAEASLAATQDWNYFARF